MKLFLCNCTLCTIFYWKGTLSCSVFREEEKTIQLMCKVLASGIRVKVVGLTCISLATLYTSEMELKIPQTWPVEGNEESERLIELTPLFAFPFLRTKL